MYYPHLTLELLNKLTGSRERSLTLNHFLWFLCSFNFKTSFPDPASMANVRDVCTWKIYFWNKRQRGCQKNPSIRFQEVLFSAVGGRFDERHILT